MDMWGGGVVDGGMVGRGRGVIGRGWGVVGGSRSVVSRSRTGVGGLLVMYKGLRSGVRSLSRGAVCWLSGGGIACCLGVGYLAGQPSSVADTGVGGTAPVGGGEVGLAMGQKEQGGQGADIQEGLQEHNILYYNTLCLLQCNA